MCIRDSSQHMRHRTWSYNEISRRYTDKDLAFHSPNAFRTQHKSNRQSSNKDEIDPILYPDLSDPKFGLTCSDYLKQHITRSKELFKQLMSAGVCREQARMVLPQSMYTEYYGTVNLNNLLKFVSLRTHEGAQWEIQQVAKACLDIAEDLFPTTVDSYKKINFSCELEELIEVTGTKIARLTKTQKRERQP